MIAETGTSSLSRATPTSVVVPPKMRSRVALYRAVRSAKVSVLADVDKSSLRLF